MTVSVVVTSYAYFPLSVCATKFAFCAVDAPVSKLVHEQAEAASNASSSNCRYDEYIVLCYAACSSICMFAWIDDFVATLFNIPLGRYPVCHNT